MPLSSSSVSDFKTRALEMLAPRPVSALQLYEKLFGSSTTPHPWKLKTVDALFSGDPRFEKFKKKNGSFWTLRRSKNPEKLQSIEEAQYVVVDLETSGQPQPDGAVMEIGAVRIDGMKIGDTYHTLVNPLKTVTPWVGRMTGLGQKKLHKAPSFSEVAGPFRDFVGDAIFVAHNEPYDWSQLQIEYERLGLEPLTNLRLCTVELSKKILPHLERQSLDALCNYYDIPLIKRHRAHHDAAATAKILLELLPVAKRQGMPTLGTLLSN